MWGKTDEARSPNVYTCWDVLNSMTPLHSKKSLLWRFNVTENKKGVYLRVKYPKALSDFNQIWGFWKIFFL